MKAVRSTTACFLEVVLIIVFFTAVVQGVFREQTVRKARCYAHCLTLYNSGSPNVGCHSDDCRQCVSACEQVALSLSDCNASCHNSSICQQSCRYINQTIKTWDNVLQGDGSPIPNPPAPTVLNKSVTSLTLSWQPGSQNISGGIVYLLKKKIPSQYPSNYEYQMVFTKPSAVLTTKQVCSSVISNPNLWPRDISFYFIVFALTENSSLVEGSQSSAIKMTKPVQVKNISFPVFTYEKSSSLNKLVLTTSIIPSDRSSLATSYGIRWQLRDTNCQSIGVSPKFDNTITDISKVTLRLYEDLLPCQHSLEVYQKVECMAGVIKILYYKYPGCQNIPSFDKAHCNKFNPPPTPDSSRSVGNLTHADIQTTPDFRFRLNVTWLPPTYSYAQTRWYDVDHGDANQSWSIFSNSWRPEHRLTSIKNTFYLIENILPNIKYKVRVKPSFQTGYVVTPVASEFVFQTPALPAKELVVEDVNVSQGFSQGSGHYYYNISWNRPSFKWGTFKGYAYKVRDGNDTRSNITNDTFVVIDGLQHSESRTFEVKPMYMENWITGVTFSTVLRSPNPIENQLKVSSLSQEGDAVEDKDNQTYSITVSWKPPSFQYKALDHYRLSYSLSGYPEFACDWSNIKDNRCRPILTNKTHYSLLEILPREHIDFTVQPVFLNSPYFQGISKNIKIDAPFPRRDLVAVRNLTHIENHPLNYTNETRFSWDKPLFKHSAIKRYDVKYSVGTLDVTSSNQNKVARRSVQVNGTNMIVEKTTTATMFSLPNLKNGQRLTFQVTPVFKRELIVGEKKEIVISKPSLTNTNAKSSELTPAERASLAIGILLLLLLAILLIVWFIRRRQKLIKEGLLFGGNGALIDHWEVPIDKICLEEELGEGAFGKVFKGMLVELPEQSAKYSIAKSIRRKSIKPLSPEDGYVVAIKMLHDFADIDQRKEFLKEIQLMKDVGAHRNIVNMLGCGTVCEPMFLIVEYLPNGDLLHYLRKRRGKATQYPDSDPRGPYHSTYCQTYFNKNSPGGGISIQPLRSDRVYVHTPELQKESKNDEIQLVSVKKHTERKENIDDAGIDQQPDDEQGMKPQKEEEDDVLTSGDLMAFAWQVSQGMEYLSKRGYVHRDLAARNVLVGNSKEAKIADFGLTRHMYEDLYQAKTNRKLPLKWMSIEAIFDQSFTSQSDVWAYGVFLWELVTLGGTPYPSINNRELLKLLKEGYRMEKPDTCDTELYNIMCSCWKEKPDDRPTFVNLREKLEEMMTRDNPYFDPTAVDESRDYYNVPSFNSAPEPGEDDDITEVIIGEASSPRQDNEVANKNTISSPNNNENPQAVEGNREDNTLTFENLSFDDNEPDLDLDQMVFHNDKTDNTAQSKADQKNLKYAKLDFEDIEFQLYRRQNHGLVL